MQFEHFLFNQNCMRYQEKKIHQLSWCVVTLIITDYSAPQIRGIFSLKL